MISEGFSCGLGGEVGLKIICLKMVNKLNLIFLFLMLMSCSDKSLVEKIESLEDKVDSYQTGVSDLNEKIVDLEQKVDDLEDELESTKNELEFHLLNSY